LLSCTSSHCPSTVVLHLSTFFVESFDFICHPWFPNNQCNTRYTICSLVDVTCRCPCSIFNYFHNVHKISLVSQPIASVSVFISDVEHLSLHFLFLCCRQFVSTFVVNGQARCLHHISSPEGCTGRRPFFLSMFVMYPS